MISLLSRYMSEKSATRLVYITIALIMAVFSLLLYRTTKNQEFDGVRINLAGRQRMLGQKLTKDIFLYKIGRISAHDIAITVGVYDNSLHALIYGGWAQLDLTVETFRKIPAMSRDLTRDTLIQLDTFWTPFRENLDRYLKTGNTGAFEYIIENNEKLLRETDRAVMVLQDASDRNTLATRNIIIAAITLVIIGLSLNLAMKMTQLRKANSQIAELEKLLPICSNCKRIRGEGKDPVQQNSWIPIEAYLRDERNIMLTHGLCPECTEKLYPEFFKESPLKNEKL